jgi:vancomycin resistance protein YoaR
MTLENLTPDLDNVEMWLQYNKVTNLRLAIALMNGLVIQPGEVFSTRTFILL